MEPPMTFGAGIVHIYQKQIKRKLKDGSDKIYETAQASVSIDKNSPFKDGQEVVIISNDRWLELISKEARLEIESKELKDVQELYSKCTITRDELSNEIKRLRNKHDHLQERLRTSLEEINKHQKVINDLSNRGFVDYIFGRKPKSLELMEGNE